MIVFLAFFAISARSLSERLDDIFASPFKASSKPKIPKCAFIFSRQMLKSFFPSNFSTSNFTFFILNLSPWPENTKNQSMTDKVYEVEGSFRERDNLISTPRNNDLLAHEPGSDTNLWRLTESLIVANHTLESTKHTRTRTPTNKRYENERNNKNTAIYTWFGAQSLLHPSRDWIPVESTKQI